jgi:hypothetical protein
VTLTNQDNTIQGAGQIGTALQGGSATFAFVNNGTINANASNVLDINTGVTTFTNNGTLEATNGTLEVDQSVTGTGSNIINAAGLIQFRGADSQNLTFTGTTGELDLLHSLTSDSQHYAGSISSSGPTLASGDIIILEDMSFVDGKTGATYDTNTHVLTVSNGTVSADISILGSYSANSFVATPTAQGTVEIHDPPLV